MSEPNRWGKHGPPPLSWFLNHKLKQKDIPPKFFAGWLGVKPAVLASWLSGAAMPDPIILAEISKLLDIPLKELTPDAQPTSSSDVTELEAELLNQFRALSPKLQQVALLQIIALREADNGDEDA